MLRCGPPRPSFDLALNLSLRKRATVYQRARLSVVSVKTILIGARSAGDRVCQWRDSGRVHSLNIQVLNKVEVEYSD